MKRATAILLGSAALMMIADTSDARSRTRVAVVPITSSGRGAGKVAWKTTVAVTKKLRKNRRVKAVLISRRRTARLRKCLQVPECVRAVSKRLRVKYLVAGHITRMRRTYHVDIRVISGSTGEVMSSNALKANKWGARFRGARVAYRLVRKAQRGVQVAAASTSATDASYSSNGPLFSRSEAESAANIIEERDQENPLTPAADKVAQVESGAASVSLDTPVVTKKDDSLPISRFFASRYWHAWTAAGLGVAALGTGAAFGSITMKANDAARGAENQREAFLNQDKARKNALTANILYGVGGAAIVSSVVMFYLESRKEVQERRNLRDLSIQLNVAQQGGGVLVQGSF